MVKISLFKKLCVTMLSAIMISGPAGINIYGVDVGCTEIKQENNEDEDYEIPGYGYTDTGYRAPDLSKSNIYSEYSDLALSANIPVSYDSRDYGYVSAVRNQGGWGTCWAFSAVAAMESYALSHGLETDADNIDLSEYNLAYLAYDDTSFKDTMGGTEGDYTTTDDMTYALKYTGGNVSYAFKVLSKWGAIVNESDGLYPDLYGSKATEYTYDMSKLSYILTGMQSISMKDKNLVKRAIMDNGALSTYYYDDDKYANNSYYYNYEISESINHSVAIVGWNDNISKENFTITDTDGQKYTPDADGAWLIKNSWGSNYYRCTDGYMWISYYDKGLLSSDVTAFAVDRAGKYDYNYQYDGNTYFGAGLMYSDGTSVINTKKCANVFSVPDGTGVQNLEAVSFATRDASVGYSIQIYKNPLLNTENTDGTFNGTDNPESGTALLTTSLTGTTTYAGYYTIPLPEKIMLNEGDVFAVVITFDDNTSVEYSYNNDNYSAYCNCNSNNESYYSVNGSTLVDLYEDYSLGEYKINLCIKAFTTKETQQEIKTGWVKEDNLWYYYDSAGVMQTSKWIKSGAKWYYVGADGIMQTSKWIKSGAKWYYVGADGIMQTSKWVKSGAKWYYVDANGVMQTSKWISGVYYVKSDGSMAVSEFVDGGKYYVDSDGKWVRGTKWLKVNGKWYYLVSGKVQMSKWVKVGTKWYYFDANGVMQTSKWISGVYYVKSDGSMAVSEWVDMGRYYVGADGKWVK